MEMQKEEAKMLQWHPAFFAEIQIELQEDAEHLIFENEHQLGTKPKEIDVLIIKKDKGRVIRKNIGRIFRQHNIVEYKSPLDYLSIDDFYKVYGYTCFYKSDTSQMDSIPIEELTITLVTGKYPRKLMHHLKTTLRYQVKKAESGIYYVTGDKIPIQIIVTKELTEAENLWLKSL
ncbi:3-isopropylmalate dehydrogenase, partial [[Ruminococcus] gnavus]|nr:3-isopropylmalate dehydrogenase [Mediterraneibacter gnavus]